MYMCWYRTTEACAHFTSARRSESMPYGSAYSELYSCIEKGASVRARIYTRSGALVYLQGRSDTPKLNDVATPNFCNSGPFSSRRHRHRPRRREQPAANLILSGLSRQSPTAQYRQLIYSAYSRTADVSLCVIVCCVAPRAKKEEEPCYYGLFRVAGKSSRY